MSMLSAQDLGIAYVGDVTDLQRATAQAGSVVDGFARKAKGDLKGVSDEAKRTDDGFTRLANGIRSAFVGSSVAVGLITLKNQLVSVTGALTDAQVQVDRLTNGFRFGAGSAEAGAREMAFVRSEADRLGLSLGSTATQYMKMVAASRGSTLAGEKTRDLFRSISEASVVMGMGQDQTERAMSAVVQMMSKGKVMAEELRGQLGEHLPGAFSIAARAMGVTEIELNKLMETGSVLSEDFLPKFAAQLRKELAGSVEQSSLSMQANLNRLSTAWLDLKMQIAQGGVGEAISSNVSKAATDVGILGETFEASRLRGEGAFMALANAAGVVAGRGGFGLIEQSAELLNGTINLLSGGFLDLNTNIDIMPANLKPANEQLVLLKDKTAAAEAQLVKLRALDAQPMNGDYFKGAIAETSAYIAVLRKAQAEKRALMGATGEPEVMGSVGSGDAALARANRAQYDRQKAAADAAMRKYATPTEKRDEEIKAMKAALGDLYTPELEKRITDSFIKPNKEGAKAARAAAKEVQDFYDVYNKINSKDVGVDASFYKDLETLKGGYQAGRISVEEYQAAVLQLISTQKVVTEAVKAETDARVAAGVANNAAFDAEFDSIEKKRLATEGQIKTGREMLEQIQFETSLIGLNTLEREQATAMRELERAGVIKGTQAYEAYAEAIQKAMADRDAQKKTLDFWTELDGTAKDLVYDLATGGEDAFKRWGDALEREVYNMLWQMTARKWIFELTGVNVGGGGGTNWIDMAQQAYNRYSGGGGAGGAGGGAGAAGGGAAVASQYGTTAGSQQTAMLAAQETGMGATAGTSWMTYAGYAALIAAAVMIAENLYAKGYTRMALGYGGSETAKFGQYSSYNTDPNTQRAGAMQNSPAMLMTNDMRKFNEALGMSSKWADILSGTTRMATLVGRKLGAYGYEANIAGGDAEVGGFARYKGGLFRSNKTVQADIDPRDAANFDAIVESTIEGAKAMARAMGLNEAAIDGYTGKIRVNFKNAKTAEEQAERMAEAMDNLNYELLKTASGGKLARDEFKQMMEGIKQDIEASGISTQGIADILVQGMTGKLSGPEVGEQLASMIVGGIYNAIASSYASQIAQLFMTQIITPIFTAIAAGVPVSQAVSAAAIKATVATATQYMAVVQEIFNNAEFQAFMQSLREGFNSAGNAAAGVAPPSMRVPVIKPINTAADEAKREKEQLEREILRLEGNTVELRRRELLEIKPGNRTLQQRVWALEDEKEILDERRDLERELLELQGNTNALRALERDALHESNRALFDQIKALEDVEKLKDTWSSVIDAMADEMKRLREEILGSSPEGRAYAAAEFAMATAQARAGDEAAAARLPDLARTLVDIAGETAGSLSDLRAVQGSTLASLTETQRILGTTYGIELPKFAVGTNYVPRDMVAMIHEGEAVVPKAYNPAANGGAGSLGEVVAVLNGLRTDLGRVEAASKLNTEAIDRLEKLTDRYTNGGSFSRSKAVPA